MAKLTRDEIREKTIEIIKRSIPELAGAELTEESAVTTGMGLDSMNFILVICTLESEFGVKIPDRLWGRLHTLGQVIDAIEKYS